MKKHKSFDCLEMKNSIQAQLREEHVGLSVEEIENRRRIWLESSEDPIAKWWRSVSKQKQDAPKSRIPAHLV